MFRGTSLTLNFDDFSILCEFLNKAQNFFDMRNFILSPPKYVPFDLRDIFFNSFLNWNIFRGASRRSKMAKMAKITQK